MPEKGKNNRKNDGSESSNLGEARKSGFILARSQQNPLKQAKKRTKTPVNQAEVVLFLIKVVLFLLSPVDKTQSGFILDKSGFILVILGFQRGFILA